MLKFNETAPLNSQITAESGDLEKYLNSRSQHNRFLSFKSFDGQLFALTGDWSIRPNKRGENCLVFEVELINNALAPTGTREWLYVAYSVLSCPRDYELESSNWLPEGSLNYEAVTNRWGLLSVRDTMARFSAVCGVKFAQKIEKIDENSKVVIVNDPSVPTAYSKVLRVKKQPFTGRYAVGDLKGQLGRFDFSTFEMSDKDVNVPRETSRPEGGDASSNGLHTLL